MSAPAQEPGHFNPITQRFEADSAHVVSSEQNGSTFPGDDNHSSQGVKTIPAPSTQPSFKDQVIGNAKKFAGQAFGREHEKVVGGALLAGHGKEKAEQIGKEVKAATEQQAALK
ncbi:BQ2448_5010 [Microbotryum intermedium]|uniref:BQ2448_5010 protein n=1 Tax=Microbotryum intermedium TaxID=269621 RepID=A0A238F3R8_9BASI|nr:BQ2448_5010 [Microbotryum intermedium]